MSPETTAGPGSHDSSGSGGTSGTEQLLRATMKRVDALDPPDDRFEQAALAAGRRRLSRRRLTRGLIGAAAAVAVGVLVLPHMQPPVTGTTSAGSAAVRPEATSGVPPEVVSPGTSQAPGLSHPDSQADGGKDNATLPALRRTMAEGPFADIFTDITVDSATGSPRFVVHLTRDDPAALAEVSRALPPGSKVVFGQSAYSARACAATTTTVRSTLASKGYAAQSTSCDPDGRLVVVMSPSVTTEEVQALRTQFGDPVVLQTSAAVP